MLRIVVVGSGLLAAGAAQAELTLCNRADVARSVAIAYSDNGAWVSEGWWSVDPGACKRVIDGPLRQRNYYYTLSGEAGFAGEGYAFCVQTAAFTLPGADGDCASLGAEVRPFAHIDTGASAESHSFDLAAVAAAKADDAAPKSDIAAPRATDADPAPAPVDPAAHPAIDAARTPSLVSGSLGEPFSVTALLQGCGDTEEFKGCTFYAEGWRWMVAEGSGSNAAALQVMADLPVNTALQVTGDLIFYGDVTVEAAVSQIDLAAPDDFAGVRAAVQGHWLSQDDPLSAFVLFGSEEQEFYDGEVVTESMVTFADRCPDGEPIGTVLVKRVFGAPPEDALCLALVEVTPDRLELSYVGRGNSLVYLRQ